ncbi:MAG: hypothetical protein SFV15_16145 [Polyangiaceae bacterium]|nr:hypothetical protein [Polyangiaceae bacterium]
MKDQMDLAKYDVRVRDRQLRRGALTPEAVTAHTEGLKDLSDEAEDLPFPQPALVSAEAAASASEARPTGPRAVPAPESNLAADDDDDDEDEDEADDDEDEDDEDAPDDGAKAEE